MTDRHGLVPVADIRATVDAVRLAIQTHNAPAAEAAWDRLEPWLGYVFGNAVCKCAAIKDGKQ